MGKKELDSSWCVKSRLHFNKSALNKGNNGVTEVFFKANFFHFKWNIVFKRRPNKLKKTKLCFRWGTSKLPSRRVFFYLILLCKRPFCSTSSNSRTLFKRQNQNSRKQFYIFISLKQHFFLFGNSILLFYWRKPIFFQAWDFSEEVILDDMQWWKVCWHTLKILSIPWEFCWNTLKILCLPSKLWDTLKILAQT